MPIPKATQTFPPFSSADFTYFAIVVENEVAQVFPMRTTAMEALVAAVSSNPKIVVLAAEQKDVVLPGWTYAHDSETFTPPVAGH